MNDNLKKILDILVNIALVAVFLVTLYLVTFVDRRGSLVQLAWTISGIGVMAACVIAFLDRNHSKMWED